MELRQLEYFLALCKTRNFTRASEILCVSQPSITKAIHRLEEELGVKLFDRSLKPIGLTEAGKIYYKRVSAILSELQAAGQEAAACGEQHKVIKVGFPPFSGQNLKALLLSEEEMAGQNILFNFVERGSHELAVMLMQGELDLAMLMDIDRPPGLDFLPLETLEAFCVLPQNHPLAAFERLTFAQLKSESLAFARTPKMALFTLVERRCREVGFTPQYSLDNPWHPNLTLVSSWVCQGYGITFVPEPVRKQLRGVKTIPMDPPLTYQMILAWKSNGFLTAAHRKMIAFIRNRYAPFSKKCQEVQKDFQNL